MGKASIGVVRTRNIVFAKTQGQQTAWPQERVIPPCRLVLVFATSRSIVPELGQRQTGHAAIFWVMCWKNCASLTKR